MTVTIDIKKEQERAQQQIKEQGLRVLEATIKNFCASILRKRLNQIILSALRI